MIISTTLASAIIVLRILRKKASPTIASDCWLHETNFRAPIYCRHRVAEPVASSRGSCA